jgi:PTH1 family peptidyl-tRNA hydrolase
VKLVVGLGNPGREYEATRHNVGWWLLDHLADVWRFERWSKEGESLATTGTVGKHRVRLLKPQTYMNLSGQALRNYLRRPFWSPATDMLVVVDEVALPVGTSRIRARGSAGGHNGLKDVERTVGSQEYARLRIGIGPDEERRKLYPSLSNFVLAPFAKDERATILESLPRLGEAVECWINEGIEATMNRFNRKDTAEG